MFELNLIEVLFLGLLYGMGPCTTFCAPILTPMVLSSAKSAKEGLFQGITFSLGRIVSYSVLGAAMGYVGASLVPSFPPQAFGAFIILIGVLTLLKKMPKFCFLFSKSKGVHATFVTGVVVGFAPCIPLLAALALAALSQSVVSGILIGVFFGVGTMLSPLLIISLVAGKWAGHSKEFQKINTVIAGIFLILVGALTLLS